MTNRYHEWTDFGRRCARCGALNTGAELAGLCPGVKPRVRKIPGVGDAYAVHPTPDSKGVVVAASSLRRLIQAWWRRERGIIVRKQRKFAEGGSK